MLKAALGCGKGLAAFAKIRPMENHAWRFHRGDGEGFAERDFRDSSWRLVDLPHDWSIEDVPGTRSPFQAELSEGKAAMGWSVGGVGWYRKTFQLDPEMRHELEIGGALFGCEVYVNGVLAATQPYGYLPTLVDCTPHLHPSGEQVIAIRVANEGHTGRWYTGSGLYREVKMKSTRHTYIVTHSLWAWTEEATPEKAVIRGSMQVKSSDEFRGSAIFLLYTNDGVLVAEDSYSIGLEPGEEGPIDFEMVIEDPVLWQPWEYGPDGEPVQPHVYVLAASLETADGQTQGEILPFGIRTIQVDAESGLLVNGKPVLLRGGCVHHDNGILGAAAPMRAELRKAAILQECGYNAVRTSHNPPSEHFLGACTGMGILVLDEIHDEWFEGKVPDGSHKSFPEWGVANAALMARRDRSHACVFAYSIGNEIFGCFSQPETALALRNAILEQDPTRPISAGICRPFWNQPGWVEWEESSEPGFRHLDIGGYNYLPDKQESDHKDHPSRPNFSTESYSLAMEEHWRLAKECPWVLGDFVWTAMDYIGESGIGQMWQAEGEPINGDFPYHLAVCGEIDLIGVPKPQSLLRRAVWGEKDVLHLAVHRPASQARPQIQEGWHHRWGWDDVESHWNWTVPAGEVLKVEAYTSLSGVRLFLNGELVGEKILEPGSCRAVFEVPYQPGILEARPMDKDPDRGLKGLNILATTGRPAQLVEMECPEYMIVGDVEFIILEACDANGLPVPGAKVSLTATVEGAGRMEAFGSASPVDVSSLKDPVHETYDGRVLLVIKALEEGQIDLHVTGLGLAPWRMTIPVVEDLEDEGEQE